MRAFHLSGAGFVALALLLQLPLILNPGYFSHDELQWLARADVDSWTAVPWSAWFDFSPFQFRPLTFNLWLLLAHAVGYQPLWMHAAVVALGTLNAGLLRRLILRLGAPRRHADVAALLFLATPYVVHVHGWVATLADLLCLGCVLLALLWLCRARKEASASADWSDALVAAALTALALLAKESAIVIPVLLLFAWPWRGRALWLPVAASALVVIAYLGLRLDIILFAPRDLDYVWGVANIPARAFEYAVYPFVPNLAEVHTLPLVNALRIGLGALGCGLLLAVAGSAGWRWLLALVVGWLVCLGPILILTRSANVYAYLASAFACAMLALAYRYMPSASRLILAVLAGVVVIHGFQVGRDMRRAGGVQQHLYAALDDGVLARARSGPALRIRALDARNEPLLQRLLHEVPSWRRLPMRATAVDSSNLDVAVTHVMQANGDLVATERWPDPAPRR